MVVKEPLSQKSYKRLKGYSFYQLMSSFYPLRKALCPATASQFSRVGLCVTS